MAAINSPSFPGSTEFSASPTSRTTRAKAAMSFADSIRQTASIVQWMPDAVTGVIYFLQTLAYFFRYFTSLSVSINASAVALTCSSVVALYKFLNP